MSEDGLPNTYIELMQEVQNKHQMKVEAMWTKFGRELILEFSVPLSDIRAQGRYIPG
jgi:hypothetical protein